MLPVRNTSLMCNCTHNAPHPQWRPHSIPPPTHPAANSVADQAAARTLQAEHMGELRRPVEYQHHYKNPNLRCAEFSARERDVERGVGVRYPTNSPALWAGHGG